MNWRALPSAVTVVAFMGLLGIIFAVSARDRFPHDLHEGLFPTCTPCHAGVAGQDRARFFSVTPDDCAGCHDGDTMDPVEWSPPPSTPTNLQFDHSLHVEDMEIDCETCHQQEGTGNRMAVARAEPEGCLDCHDASSHLAPEAECATCHLPLTEATELSSARIAVFPKPARHDEPGFLSAHGGLAQENLERCATCHAQEFCASCHLNAGRVAVIQELGSDARVAGLFADREGRWPEPASHEADDWMFTHREDALGAIESCANCHGQSSCRQCHGEEPPSVVNQLTIPEPDGAQGVLLLDARPPGHVPGFAFQHQTAAATGSPDCESCHAPTYCTDCHNAPSRPGFHPANYALRHGAEAFARDTDCAGCHSTEVFCRDCHAGVGLSSGSSVNSSYHDAQPFWLIAHGRAARQGMESCASCHQQTDCLECHSARTGWRVNPHGPNFSPDRAADSSLLMCSLCHAGDPRN